MLKSLSIITLSTILLFAVSAVAADKVVVIPLNTCSGGLTNCSGKCVDTMNNPFFCGDCTTTCGPGVFCNQGVCKKQAGMACTEHTECLSGKCTTGGTCAIVSKVVFVSSVGYTGNLEGLTGADLKCQGLATAAGLPGTYMAWLSDSSSSPSTRFLTKSSFPYIRVDGTPVAKDWTDLTNGSILNDINVTEDGDIVFPKMVWTNTTVSGTVGSSAPQQENCYEWAAEIGVGRAGDSESKDATWTALSSPWDCDLNFKLYCFQQ